MITYLARTAFLLIMLVATFVEPVGAFEFVRQSEGRLYLRNHDYNEYDGHPENWAVVQDQRGVLYFGNNWILEYDGVSWRLIRTEKETKGLSLDVDRTGIIYVGLENGFGFLAPDSLGQMRFVPLDDRLPEGAPQVTEVWKVHATTQGIYFFNVFTINNRMTFCNTAGLLSFDQNQQRF
ncbi:hypothetical protein MJD09_25130, partial [bacterium]|nr:hypothetical protein [bacterium]